MILQTDDPIILNDVILNQEGFHTIATIHDKNQVQISEVLPSNGDFPIDET